MHINLYSSYSIIRVLVYPDFDYPVHQKYEIEYSIFLCTNHSNIEVSGRNDNKITLKPLILYYTENVLLEK